MASAKKITVKLLVDKERSRVVYAEADKDFVDILFSFLTLPLSTIIKALNKHSTLGCMDNLYESVEKLDIQYLQTEACKTMLLHPRSEAVARCEELKINIDDTKPRVVYVCKKDDCCSKQTCLVSSAQNAQCTHCKEKMNVLKICPKDDVKLFVKEGVKYIISNDLRVEPATVMHILSLLQKMDIKMDIKDGSVLEERYMDISEEEILALLKRLLVSEMPVTDLYFGDKTEDATRDHVGKKEVPQVKTESNQETNTEGISIKLFINKHTNKVLCAEVDDNFLNILFSFLTLPLGSLIKILNKNTGMGCVDNLYRSAEDLSLEHIESELSRSILLSPKLGPFFGISNNILKLDEINPREGTIHGCLTCYWKNNNEACSMFAKCGHGVGKSLVKELNPKSPQGGTEKGGGYVKGPGKFMVTDDLRVSPLSTSSIISIVSKIDSSFDSVVERKVVAGEIQVLNLLRAAITSETPLTDVFSPRQESKEKVLGIPTMSEVLAHLKTLNSIKNQTQPTPTSAANKASKGLVSSVQSAYCEVCKINCNSQEVLNDHKTGKKHMRNVQKLQMASKTPKPAKVPKKSEVQKDASVKAAAQRPKALSTKKDLETKKVQKGASVKAAAQQPKASPTKKDLEKKKQKVLNGGAAADAVRVCGLCNVVCNSESVFASHILGQKHMAKLNK